MLQFKECVSQLMKKLSLIAIALCLITCIYKLNKDQLWRIDFVLIADAHGYYEYLPAAFIYHDIDLKFTDELGKQGRPGLYYYSISDTYKRYIKYPMGVAVMELPFFTIAYWLAPFFHQPQNGFSDIFEIALLIGVQIYLLIGLLFLRRLLLHYFSDFITAVTLLTLVIGTNLFIYCTAFALMSHVFTFSLSCVFLYLMQNWFTAKKRITLIKMGLLAGLMLLIRNTNILWILMFAITSLAIQFQSKKGFNKLFLVSFIKNNFILSCLALLVYMPQLLYWHYVSGRYFFDSYGGEHFFFSNPHLIETFFSYRSGWLLYSPLMILSLVGIFYLNKNLRIFQLPILILFTPFAYLTASWWCWWYSGFGLRAFIDVYALLTIPMAALLTRIFKSILLIRFIFIAVLTFLIYLNLFQTWQYTYGVLHYDSMTKRAYWAVFLKKEKPPGFDTTLKNPDMENAFKHGFEKE